MRSSEGEKERLPIKNDEESSPIVRDILLSTQEWLKRRIARSVRDPLWGAFAPRLLTCRQEV
jgi:hypothetical protein